MRCPEFHSSFQPLFLPESNKSSLLATTNPAAALKQEDLCQTAQGTVWATDTAAARGQKEEEAATSGWTRTNSSNLTLTSMLEGDAELSTQLSGPSSPPPQKRWQTRQKCPLGHFQLQPPAESLNQRYRNLRAEKASKCINWDEYGWLGQKSTLIWQSRNLAKTWRFYLRHFHAERQKVQHALFYWCQ